MRLTAKEKDCGAESADVSEPWGPYNDACRVDVDARVGGRAGGTGR